MTKYGLNAEELERGKDMPGQIAEMSRSPETARYTVAPGRSSQITLKTLPHAVCTLHPEDETSADRHLKLYADDEGLIRFYVQPSREHETVARFVIECEADGNATRYPLELRPHYRPTADMPPPQPEPVKPLREGARVRPALLGDDLLRLSDEELIKRGYPIRPNPEQAPEAFNAWRRMVSRPATFIEPRQVARPDIGPSPIVTSPLPPLPPQGFPPLQESDQNKCGFVLSFGQNGAIDFVTGTWIVPRVSGESNRRTYSGCWVGLDGYDYWPAASFEPVSPGDLVQAGTAQETWDFDFIVNFSSSTYYAWTEVIPPNQSRQPIGNFVVRPGDEIFVSVWIGEKDSFPNPQGSVANFFLQNITRGEYTRRYTPLSGIQVAGMEASWIVERPMLTNGSLADLADYHSVTMSNAFALMNGVLVPYFTNMDNQLLQFLFQLTMMNDPTVLSTVTPLSDTSMRFDWNHFL